jgi:hypothetical protein
VYVAASREVAQEADRLASDLRARGYNVVSKWHMNVTAPIVDPSQHKVRQDILAANLKDMDEADVVVALMLEGKPKATYAEIGYALADGQLIVWYGPDLPTEQDPLSCIFDAHPRVVRVCTEESICATLDAITAPDSDEMTMCLDRFAQRLKSLVDLRIATIEARMQGRAFVANPTIMAPLTSNAVVSMAGASEARDWFKVCLDFIALGCMSGQSAVQKAVSALGESKGVN